MAENEFGRWGTRVNVNAAEFRLSTGTTATASADLLYTHAGSCCCCVASPCIISRGASTSPPLHACRRLPSGTQPLMFLLPPCVLLSHHCLMTCCHHIVSPPHIHSIGVNHCHPSTNKLQEHEQWQRDHHSIRNSSN